MKLLAGSLTAISVLFAASAWGLTEQCHPDATEERVAKAVLAIAALHGTVPAEFEVHSFSSRRSTWGVILKSPGSRETWKVKTDESGCRILRIETT